jgi:hypothetical protein
VRRVLRFLLDAADGVIASMLYGHQGGLTHTTYGLELENQRRMRRWAAGDEKPTQDDAETPANLDERIRRFRDHPEPRDPS